MSRKPSTSASRSLSDEKLAELKKNASMILAECRKQILTRYPFIGGIAMTMDLIPVRDCRCPTACCDGRNIYFDIDFLSSLKPDERTFVLGHEIWHAVCSHLERNEGRNHNLFNVAADIEVNQLLSKDGFSCPKDACTPASCNVPPNLSAEDYYELLLKQQPKQNAGNNGQQSARGGSGSGMPNSGNAEEQQNQSDDGNPINDSGNKDGKLSGQFDKHITKGETAEDMAEDEVEDKYGKVGFDPDFKPSIDEHTAEKIREAVVSVAQQIMQRGTLPDYIEQKVKGLLTPKVPWQEVLSQFITRSVGAGKNSWSRPNRRFAASGTYLPSHAAECCKVGIMIDTSGSCVDEIKKFLSEVNGIVKAFPTYKMTIVQCDTEVKDVKEYDADSPIDLEHEEFKTYGYGGTTLLPGLQHFQKNDCEVDCIVAFSDCECEQINEGDVELPLIWVCTNTMEHKNIKCGEILTFDKKA